MAGVFLLSYFSRSHRNGQWAIKQAPHTSLMGALTGMSFEDQLIHIYSEQKNLTPFGQVTVLTEIWSKKIIHDA